MAKLQIALLEDAAYVAGFSAYVGQNRETWMQLHGFTGIDNLIDFLGKKQIDVLLAGEKYMVMAGSAWDGLFTEGRIPKVIVLSEDNHETVENRTEVFKYQSVEAVLRSVCRELAADEQVPALSSRCVVQEKEFIGVYSIWGECHSMEFAHRLCLERGKQERVLYINLHLLNAMQVCDVGQVQKVPGMSELIYYIRQKRKKMALKMRSLVREHNGVQCIFPVEDYRDLLGMTKEDAYALCRFLATETEYEVIVFDIGFLHDVSLWLLQRCDRIFLQRECSMSEKAMRISFETLLVKEKMEECMRKIQYVEMHKD